VPLGCEPPYSDAVSDGRTLGGGPPSCGGTDRVSPFERTRFARRRSETEDARREAFYSSRNRSDATATADGTYERRTAARGRGAWRPARTAHGTQPWRILGAITKARVWTCWLMLARVRGTVQRRKSRGALVRSGRKPSIIHVLDDIEQAGRAQRARYAAVDGTKY
jgi:hypothetical protein